MGPIGRSRIPSINSANGIRTRVWALRGPRPSPLDDSAATTRPVPSDPQTSPFSFQLQARRESNPQPPVLETGALPIELRTYSADCGQPGSVRYSQVLSRGWLTGIEPATP